MIMRKAEIVAEIAKKTGVSKAQAEKGLNAFIEVVTEALAKGDKISLIGFGTFEVRNRAARTGVNPQTKEKMTIAARKIPAFKPGKALKDAV